MANRDHKCELCPKRAQEHHHVFGASNKKKSEKYGLMAYLCNECHQDHRKGVHHNRRKDLQLKEKYQRKFEAEQGSREDFLREFGRNYL